MIISRSQLPEKRQTSEVSECYSFQLCRCLADLKWLAFQPNVLSDRTKEATTKCSAIRNSINQISPCAWQYHSDPATSPNWPAAAWLTSTNNISARNPQATRTIATPRYATPNYRCFPTSLPLCSPAPAQRNPCFCGSLIVLTPAKRPSILP